MMRFGFASVLAVGLAVVALPAGAAEIRMVTGDTVIMGAISEDSATARDFLASLPVTLPMTRLRDREYYGSLPGQLSVDGPRQEGFANGDIGYTARSHYFAVFFDNSRDPDISELIVIGTITSDLSAFDGMNPDVAMRIERVAGP